MQRLHAFQYLVALPSRQRPARCLISSVLLRSTQAHPLWVRSLTLTLTLSQYLALYRNASCNRRKGRRFKVPQNGVRVRVTGSEPTKPCAESSKAEGIKQRVGRCHKGHAAEDGIRICLQVTQRWQFPVSMQLDIMKCLPHDTTCQQQSIAATPMVVNKNAEVSSWCS
eukprot:166731-Chlamydomonas_euryale.AAC.3